MEFDTTVTAGAFFVLIAVVLAGTFTSPMSQDTQVMVGAGQVVLLLVALLLGIKHGQYRSGS